LADFLVRPTIPLGRADIPEFFEIFNKPPDLPLEQQIFLIPAKAGIHAFN
jgi:hypothetical protein